MLMIRGLDTSFKRNVFKCRQKGTVAGNVQCMYVYIYYFICVYIEYIYIQACINISTHIHMRTYKFVLCCQSVKFKAPEYVC